MSLQTFQYDSLKIETFYKGDEVEFKTYLNDELIKTDSMRPSPLYNFDDTETMLSIIGFTETYPELVDFWCRADELRTMISDFMEKDNEEFLIENELTEEFCERIKKYITND